MKGYQVKQHPMPVKRYCRTMELKPDDALIREYVHRHSEGESWPEILQGIRSVGIMEMEIYLLGKSPFSPSLLFVFFGIGLYLDC